MVLMRLAFAGSSVLRPGRPEGELPAPPQQGERGGVITRLASLGDDLIPRRRRVEGSPLPGEVLARRIRQQAAPGDLEPARAEVDLVEELVGRLVSRFDARGDPADDKPLELNLKAGVVDVYTD